MKIKDIPILLFFGLSWNQYLLGFVTSLSFGSFLVITNTLIKGKLLK